MSFQPSASSQNCAKLSRDLGLLLTAALVVLCAAWTPVAQAAGPDTSGPDAIGITSWSDETLVNTTTAGDQWTYFWSIRTVAVQPDGSFIQVWIDTGGLDGQAQGVFGQRFNASGARVGGEFQVNTLTSGSQGNATIAVAPDGSFIVAWDGPGSSTDVFAQRFTKDGVKIGDEFLLNTTVSGGQQYPEMDFFPDGTFVAAFVDGSQTVLQRFDAIGRTIGQETRISSGTGAVVMDSLTVRPDKLVFLTWTDCGRCLRPVVHQHPSAHRPSAKLNQTTTGTQEYSIARVDGEGNIVVVWESDGQDGSGMGVYGRRYDASFTPLGDEFALTTNPRPAPSSSRRWRCTHPAPFSSPGRITTTVTAAARRAVIPGPRCGCGCSTRTASGSAAR